MDVRAYQERYFQEQRYQRQGRRQKKKRYQRQGRSGIHGGQNERSEAALRWFEHVKKRCPHIPVRRCGRLDMWGLREGRGRPKKHWEVSGHDMTLLQLTEGMTLDGRVQRSGIKVERFMDSQTQSSLNVFARQG